MTADQLRTEIISTIRHLADMHARYTEVFGMSWGYSPVSAMNERLMTLVYDDDAVVLRDAIGALNEAMQMSSSIADAVLLQIYPYHSCRTERIWTE